MKRIITLSIVFLLLSSKLFSQKLQYENDSKWFWGLNMGVAWQTTDVKNKNNYGYGLTFGRSFNYDYGKGLSFDIRARYLRGYWLGQDVDSTQIPSNYSGVLSQYGTNYKDSFGITVNNFQTDIHRLALELVLHANGIRERSGWDPYIFGGIGFTWRQTYGDLKNNNSFDGQLYDYQNTPLSSASIASMLDETYDTPLDGNSYDIVGNPIYTVKFMPSLGFGLGYQLSKRVSIGIEHKTTFTRGDYFDGVAAAGTYKQDFYHYTSGYLRFQIKARGTTDVTHHTDPIPDPVVHTPQPPVVTYSAPVAPGTVVTTANYTVVANIKYVNSWANITFKQDGVENPNFTFNTSTQRFESNVVLHTGQNNFEIKGTNPDGSDVELTHVIYQRDTGTPPVVTITNPATSPANVTNPQFNFSATVLNVQNQSQVKMTFNGQNFPNFVFNTTTGGLTTPLTLIEGTNTVTVTGTNTFGTDTETATIVYTKPQTLAPPVVTYTSPSVNPYTASNQSYNVVATVTNVTQSSGIKVSLNGTNITNFTFTPSTKKVAFTASLIEGANTIVITGTNTAGIDAENQTIIYNRPATLAPPVVTYVTPSVDPFTTNTQTYNVTATVTNVSQSSGVKVNLNGSNITNFTFNPSTTMVSFNASLIEGNNVVIITGTNTAGVDAENQTIVYNKPVTVVPPVVTYVTPSVNPFSTNTQTYNVSATVTNVTQSSGVKVSLNGSNITNFTFNPSTTMVAFNASLIEGANMIVITGTNTAGVDAENQTIIYNKPVTVIPPVVTYISPAVDPYTSTTPTYNVTATVTNVAQSSGINVTLNGTSITNFTFNPSNTMLSFPTSLIEGANVIVITGTNTAGTDTENQTIVYTKPVTILPPVVTFVTPSTDPFTTSTNTYNVSATVTNVSSSNSINVKLNGSNITNFSFNPTTMMVTFTASLIEGANIVNIMGTNTAGVDTEDQTIIYNKPVVVLPPVVTYVTPSVDPFTTNTQTYNVSAMVTNVPASNGVSVKLNGSNITNFTFNPSSTMVAFTASLIEGNNVIVITGTNTAGTDAETQTIVYNKPVTVIPPVVTFIKPTTEVAVTVKPFTMIATVMNVDTKSQITVSKDGQVIDQALYTFDAGTKKVSFNTSLDPGVNEFTVTGTNTAGTDSKTAEIVYREQVVACDKPVITMINPAVSNNTNVHSTFYASASMTYITSINQIQLKLNGVVQSGGVFNPQTNMFTNTIELTQGNNIIDIIATNDCGTVKESRSVKYVPCSAPTIQALLPNQIQTETEATTAQISATVSNVTSKEQIVFEVNGINQAFDYNQTSHTVLATANLAEGKNTISIVVVTDCGTANYQWEITKATCKTPVVSILTSSTASGGTTQNIVFSMSALLENIISNDQITVKLNNNPIQFNYNVETRKLLINQHLNQGINRIMIEAKNNCGTATKQHIVTFTPSQDVNSDIPHAIIVCPQTAVAGAPALITGTVSGVTNASQVVIKANGQVVSAFNPSVSQNTLTFQFTVPTTASAANYTVEVVATNVFGTDTKTCSFTTTAATGGGKSTGKPTGTGTTPKPGTSTTPTPTTPVPTPTPTTPPGGRGGR